MSIDQLATVLGENLWPQHKTEFQLQRWMDNNHGNLPSAVKKYNEYVKVLKSLGFTSKKAVENYIETNKSQVKQFVGHSKLQSDWINENDNGFVFVEKSIENPDEVLKAVCTYDYMKYLIAESELLQYMIIDREEETGLPSHGICIYDIKDIHSDYKDKSKDIHKLLNLRVHLWKDYYANLLKGIFIVNGGILVEATSMIPLFGRNLINTILKYHIRDRLCDTIEVGDRELQKAVSLDAIPVGLRGRRLPRDDELPNCCNKIRPVEKEDYFQPDQIFRKFGTDVPESINLELKDGESKIFEFYPEGKTIVLFSCDLSTITRFYFVQNDTCLTPPMKLRSIKVPNEGSAHLLSGSNSPVVLHIANHGDESDSQITNITFKVAFV